MTTDTSARTRHSEDGHPFAAAGLAGALDSDRAYPWDAAQTRPVVLLFAGERAAPWLKKAAAWLQRRWAVVLAGLFLFVGGVLTVLGGAGLIK